MPETTNDHPAPTPDAMSEAEARTVVCRSCFGTGKIDSDGYCGNCETGRLAARLAEAEKSDRERFAQVSRLTARLLAAEASWRYTPEPTKLDDPKLRDMLRKYHTTSTAIAGGEATTQPPAKPKSAGDDEDEADYVHNLWLDALGGASVRLTGKPLDVSVGETDEESIGATVGKFVDRVEEVMFAHFSPAGDGRDKLRKAEKSRDYYIAESYKLKTDRDALAAQQPSADANVNAVVAKHRERAAKGLKKYGVTTERTDLSAVEWMRHFQEEAMDAAVYAERWIRDQTAPAVPSPSEAEQLPPRVRAAFATPDGDTDCPKCGNHMTRSALDCLGCNRCGNAYVDGYRPPEAQPSGAGEPAKGTGAEQGEQP